MCVNCPARFEILKLAEFQGSWTPEFENDDAECAQSIQIDFSSVTSLNANQPYIIKTGRDVTSFTVDGVTVQPGEVEQVFGSFRKGTLAEFIGTYVAGTVVEDGGLFIAQNKFWYSVGLTKMKAFRCYLNLQYTLDYTQSSGTQKFATFRLDGTTTTEIGHAVVGGTPDDRVYSLSGVCIGRERGMQRLPKDVYIVGGKKVINK